MTPADFYKQEGWKRRGSHSTDALINENLTPVASAYVSEIRKRIGSPRRSGNQVLDIGSGPIQYPEYLEISSGYGRRVCVDFSEEALTEALRTLTNDQQLGVGLHGDYLEMDLTSLGKFDLIVCINVLYHLPPASQLAAIRKALTELSPDGILVIVYSNPNSPFNILLRAGATIKQLLRTVSGTNDSTAPSILFEPMPLKDWKQFGSEANIKIRAWRTLPPRIEQFVAREKLGGEALFRFLYRLEQTRGWYRFSSYITIVMRREQETNRDESR